MHVRVQFMLEANPYLKRYLHEHSNYYKNLIRNPEFIIQMEEMMKKEYGLTFPLRLAKIKDNLSMFNNFMEVLK